MKFFTKKEEQENALTNDAQAFLNRIANGVSEAEAQSRSKSSRLRLKSKPTCNMIDRGLLGQLRR